MYISQLKTFIEVAETLSFSEAATRLCISQSAVSQNIAELERISGTLLINRNKRPFKLTTAGEIFLQGACDIIRKSEETMEKIELAARGYIGRIKVGFLAGVEQEFLPRGIKEFCDAYPKTKISLQHFNWAGVNQAMELEHIDVGFSFSYGLDHFPGITGKPLYTDKLYIAMHRNHHLAHHTSLDMTKLKHEPFVTFHRQTDYLLHDLTKQVCAEHGYTPNVTSYVYDMDAILFIVKTGQSISLVPGAVRQADKQIRFVEINGKNKHLDLMLVWKKDNDNPAIPLFVEKMSAISSLKMYQY